MNWTDRIVPVPEPAIDIVIGRGPSAFGAILGMVGAGLRPAVLSPTGPWTGPTVDPGQSPTSSVQRKTSFGSSQMYDYPESPDLRFERPNPLPISAVPGGLSTVWGSNIQVFGSVDLQAWGDDAADMRMAYAAILSRIPHVGRNDQMSERFPWPVPFPGTQPMSSRLTAALARRGTPVSGAALICVARNASAPVGQGCIACGVCLEGCPEGVIFDAEQGIGPLIEAHELPAIDGLAMRLETVADGVRITWLDRLTQETRHLTVRRVVLAAGSVASTILLQRSGLLPGPAELDDTQVFYAPLLSLSRPDRLGTQYSMAQLFAADRAGGAQGDRAFHLSIYESDPSFRERAAHLVGPLAKAIPRRLFQQVLAAIGFIPSSASGRIVVEQDSDGVAVRTRPSSDSREYIHAVMKAVRPDLATVGLRTIRPLTQIPEVGASYHVGHLICDADDVIDSATGQLRTGDSSIVVVDGAALPAILTGPVTLTIMANAYRLGGRLA